jgi:hypothetical protein
MKKMIVMSVALLGLFFGGMALNSANANTMQMHVAMQMPHAAQQVLAANNHVGIK